MSDLFREAHNPFLKDEYNLPGFNSNDQYEESPNSWTWPYNGNINGDKFFFNNTWWNYVNVLDVVVTVNYVLGNTGNQDLINMALEAPINNFYSDIPYYFLEDENGQNIVNVMDFNGDGVINILDIISLCSLILSTDADEWEN